MSGIGERIRHARVYCGWSQTQLAEILGVTQPFISQVENGLPPTDELITRFARASGFSPAFFRRGPLPDLPQGSLRFRKRATALKGDDDRIRVHIRSAIEVTASLSRVAELPPVRLKPIQGTVTPELIESQMVRSAREWMGVGSFDPIPNVARALERAGILVVGSSQSIPKHQGVSYWPDFPVGRPIICFTRGMAGDRQRLTLAHELGHLLLHQIRDPEEDQAEAEAFRFAGALLLPMEAATEAIRPPVTLNSLARIKAHWGIAISALVRRCLDLQIIDEPRRVSLEKQISARGWRKEEPVEVPEEHPTIVRRLLEVNKGVGNPRSVTENLGVPPMLLRDLIA